MNKSEATEAPTGELILKADAIALLTEIVFDEPPHLDSETLCRLYAEEQINKLPSAEVKTKCIAQIKIDRDDLEDLVNEKVIEIVEKMSETKTGEWIKDGQFWRCSECGTRIFSESYMDRKIYHAFCSRCGTKMENEDK